MIVPTFTTRAPHDYAGAVDKNHFNGDYTADSVIVTLSVALALNNSLEMVLLISTTFKRWRGLYFWSLSLCNLGVVLYALGIMLGYFKLGPRPLGSAILDIGWMMMISCQALVLYSRLGLLLDNVKIIAAVKWMIIVTSCTLLPVVCILDFGTTYSNISAFAQGYFYIEHLQMTFITLQELIISGLYVWKTLALLKIISGPNTRSTVWQLLSINVIIIIMDVALVVLQYKHYQLYQEAIKGFVYSVKLRLELNILSKLVDLVHGNSAARSMTLDAVDSNALEGKAQAEMRREQDMQMQGSTLVQRSWPSNNFAKGGPSQTSEEENASGNSNGNGGFITQPKFEALAGTGAGGDGGGGLNTTSNGANDVTNPALTQVLSHQSRYSARASGRESDILYADFMRDCK